MTSMTIETADALPVIAQHWKPLDKQQPHWGPLIEAMSGSRFVLMGEASHGTREFYQARIELTKLLIVEAGFKAIAWEADWPSAYRVNCYVRGHSDDPDAETALDEFRAFPTWMWRNHEVREFVTWLRNYNSRLPNAEKVGIYGLDL